MVELSMDCLTLALASLMDESIRVKNFSGSSALHNSILDSFSFILRLPYLEYCLLMDSVKGLSSILDRATADSHGKESLVSKAGATTTTAEAATATTTGETLSDMMLVITKSTTMIKQNLPY